jgi:hypothetical protein
MEPSQSPVQGAVAPPTVVKRPECEVRNKYKEIRKFELRREEQTKGPKHRKKQGKYREKSSAKT